MATSPSGFLIAVVAAMVFAICAVTLLPMVAKRVAEGMRRSLELDLANYRSAGIESLMPASDGRPLGTPLRLFLAGTGGCAVFLIATHLHESSVPYLAFVTALFVLTCVDEETHILPPTWVDALLAAGIMAALLEMSQIPLKDAVLGASCGWALWWVPVRLAQMMTGQPATIGDGDLRLFAAIGGWLGWSQIIEVSAGSLVAGLAYYATLRAVGHRPSYLPFGPPITAAVYLTLIARYY